MLIVAIVSSVFVLSFVLLFIWIRQKNKRDPDNEKMNIFLTGIVAAVLSFILAGVAAFFLFMILGSTNVVNTLFTLDISKKDLILMSVIYLSYIITIDNVFQMIIRLLTRNIYLIYFSLLWLRMVAFYFMATYFHISHYTNMLISGGVALMLSLLEFFYEKNQQNKDE